MKNLVVTSLTLALVACGSGYSGSEAPENGAPDGVDKAGTERKGDPSAPPGAVPFSEATACSDEHAEIAMDDASVLGFDAEALLEITSQPMLAPGYWVSPTTDAEQCGGVVGSSSSVESSLDSTTAMLSVSITPMDRPAYVFCEAALFVPVMVTLESDDGALTESFEANLTSADGVKVDVWTRLDVTTLDGDLASTLTGGEVFELELDISITEESLAIQGWIRETRVGTTEDPAPKVPNSDTATPDAQVPVLVLKSGDNQDCSVEVDI